MSRIVITNSNQFESIIEKFEEGITNLEIAFEKQNENFDLIESKEIWKGDLQEAVSDKYNELSDKYDTIISSLRTFSDFMSESLSSYKEFERKTNSAQEENSAELDVNS